MTETFLYHFNNEIVRFSGGVQEVEKEKYTWRVSLGLLFIASAEHLCV